MEVESERWCDCEVGRAHTAVHRLTLGLFVWWWLAAPAAPAAPAAASQTRTHRLC